MAKTREFTTPSGHKLRVSMVDTDTMIAEKLQNNPNLMEFKAKCEIYDLHDKNHVLDVFEDFFDAALKKARRIKAKSPNKVGYRILQIVE